MTNNNITKVRRETQQQEYRDQTGGDNPWIKCSYYKELQNLWISEQFTY